MKDRMILEKQVDGRWQRGQKEPGGQVMHIAIKTLEDLMREHCRTHNSICAGLREDEEITSIMFESNGEIKISINSTGE